MKNLLKTLSILIVITFIGVKAMAQTPQVTREAAGAACQVDFSVVNTSGTTLNYRYEWLLAGETHLFYISNISYFKVTARFVGGAVYNYTVYKSSIDATPGTYYVVSPAGGSYPKLYIKNSNPSYPTFNQYSFKIQ